MSGFLTQPFSGSYTDIIAGYQQMYAQAMTSLQGYGDQQKVDLANQYKASSNAGQMQLQGAGLGGTILAPAARTQALRSYSQAQNSLADTLTNQRLQYQTQLGGQVLGAEQGQMQYGLQQGQLAVSQGQLGVAQATQQANAAYQTGELALGTTTAAQNYALGQGQLALGQTQAANQTGLGYAQLNAQQNAANNNQNNQYNQILASGYGGSPGTSWTPYGQWGQT